MSLDEVASQLRISADIQRPIAWLQDDMEAGFDMVYLHQVARDMDRFIDSFAAEVIPLFPA